MAASVAAPARLARTAGPRDHPAFRRLSRSFSRSFRRSFNRSFSRSFILSSSRCHSRSVSRRLSRSVSRSFMRSFSRCLSRCFSRCFSRSFSRSFNLEVEASPRRPRQPPKLHTHTHTHTHTTGTARAPRAPALAIAVQIGPAGRPEPSCRQEHQSRDSQRERDLKVTSHVTGDSQDVTRRERERESERERGGGGGGGPPGGQGGAPCLSHLSSRPWEAPGPGPGDSVAAVDVRTQEAAEVLRKNIRIRGDWRRGLGNSVAAVNSGRAGRRPTLCIGGFYSWL